MPVASEQQPTAASIGTRYVALTGNPNCGKTTLFNALTGLRAKVGNYPGVTVERKEGRLKGVSTAVTIIDLPGTYSLSPKSLDEQISRDVLFHRVPEIPAPDLVVVVIDASNLERNLYYATQVIELGYRTIVALNMTDVAEENGHYVDAEKLSGRLGTPVIPMVASTGKGLGDLKQAIVASLETTHAPKPLALHEVPEAFEAEIEKIVPLLEAQDKSPVARSAEASLLLTDEKFSELPIYAPARQQVQQSRQALEKCGLDWQSVLIESRYATIARIHEEVTTETLQDQATLSDKLDQILTHKFWGILIFIGIMGLMFQSIFSFAEIPMGWIDAGVTTLSNLVSGWMPAGDFRSLVVEGIIAGVGAVIVFLPQICLLFLFIGLLEDTGYMARAAFLMDRLMSKVGLHGKSFIPMLSSFACAIPGIMATRTIETPKDRLVTILVAPLMSCSARLPVYLLLIAACVPNQKVAGFFTLKGLTLLSMYLLGIVVALLMAWLFKKTILKGETPMLIMELPPYKRPVFFVVMRHMWDRAKLFLKRAGTIILGISIVLWFLLSYPKDPATTQKYEAQRQAAGGNEQVLEQLDGQERGELLRNSFGGRMGRVLEPAIAPLGFDWKIGIGIVASFAAREVFVSTMSTVYSVADYEDSDEGIEKLAGTLQAEKHPDGRQVFTPLVGVTLMVFYVFALQCVSTVAIVRRETNSWKWPLFQWAYMGALAWGFAFGVYQVGRLFGFQ